MKIRNGFVSNSSSASFILKFSFSGNKDNVIELIKKSNKWIDEQWEDWTSKPNAIFKEGRDIEGNKRRLSFKDNVAEYNMYTTMFNDWMDVGAWKFARALSDNRIPGLKLESIRKTEEEYNDCDCETTFDKYCWEYDSYITNPWEDSKKDNTAEIKDAKMKQKEYDWKYLSYLNEINSPLTKKEELFLAKGYLSEK